MFKIYIVSILLITPALVLAADLKAEVAKCASSPTALKRLACFDELAKGLGNEIQSQYSPSDKKVAAQAKASLSPPADTKQADRLKLIQELINQGAFKKVEKVGNVARIWVTPTFHALDYDVKTKISGLVYDYYRDETNGTINLVLLNDSKNGKQVGTFGQRGLDLD